MLKRVLLPALSMLSLLIFPGTVRAQLYCGSISFYNVPPPAGPLNMTDYVCFDSSSVSAPPVSANFVDETWVGTDNITRPLPMPTPVGNSPSPPRPLSFSVTINAFIPAEWVWDPFGYVIFEGDHRWFARDGSSRMTSVTQFMNPRYSVQVTLGQPSHHTGLTVSYDHGTSVDGSGHITSAARADWEPYVDKKWDWATASTSGMHCTPQRISSNAVRLTCAGAANNPLVPGSPDIDYHFTIRFDLGDQQVLWTLEQGCHDPFPAYEVWLDNSAVYQFMHDSGSGPGQLFHNCNVTASQAGGVINY